MHDGRERHGSGPGVVDQGRGLLPPGHPGEGGHGALLEDVTGADHEPPPPGGADQHDGGDAVAAQGEEAALPSDGGQFQQVGDQFGEDLLGRVLRPLPGRRVRDGGRGECRAVHLPAHGEREAVQDDDVGGHQGPGQEAGAVGEQVGGERRRGRVVGGDVADEPGRSRQVVAYEDEGVPDVRVAEQGGAHLRRFDPYAAQLHLVVGPAQILQLAPPVPAGQVAGAVQPLPRCAERIGDEAFGGPRASAQVAERQLGSAQIQFAAHPGRHGPQGRVQDVGAGTGSRSAERYEGPFTGHGGAGGDVDGRLGRPVLVDDGGGEHLGAAPRERVGEGFAAAEDPPERGAVRRVRFGGEQGEHRGHEVDGVDAVFADQPGDAGGFPVLVGSRDDDGGPGEERAGQLPDRDVEAGGRLGQHAVPRSEGVAPLGPGEPVGERPVRDDDGLGAAGGAGGVQDVRGLGGVGCVGGEVGGGRRARVVEEQDGTVEPVGQQGPVGAVGEEHRRRVRFEHGGQPGRRVVRVQGQIRPAGLEHGVCGGDQIRRPGQEDGDGCAMAHPVLAERCGERPGVAEEFAVPDGAVRVDHGGGVGRAGGPLGELPGDGQRSHRLLCDVPGGEEPVVLVVGEQAQAADGPVGPVREGDQHACVPVGDLAYGRLVEERGAVRDTSVQHAVDSRFLDQGDGEVELGGAGVHRDGCAGQAAEFRPLGGAGLVVQHHLEQRVAFQRAFDVQQVHQALEGDVGVVECVERGRPGAGHELGRGRVAADVGAQDQGVDEEADEVVHRGVVASRDERSHGNVVGAADPVEQDGERRVGDHERGRAGAGGEPPQPGGDLGGEAEGDDASVVAGVRPARPVHGEGKFRRESGQLVPPVADLPADLAVLVGLVAEQLPLPQGVVGVLEGQRRPPRGPAVRAGGERGGQVAEQRAHGPFVPGDVVQDEEQHVVVRARAALGDHPEQAGAQRRLPLQGEGRARGLGQGGVQGVRRGGPGGEGYGGVARGEDALHGAALALGEHRAQHLVSGGEVGERPLQRLCVEGSGEAERDGHVVRGGGFLLQPVEKPEALLGGGQRRFGGARPVGRFRGPGGPAGSAQQGGGRRRGPRGEQVADGQLRVQERPGPSHQAHRGQRVAAVLEEVLVRAEAGRSEGVGEDPAEQFGALVVRGQAAGARRFGGAGGGEGGTVGLAVLGERQRLDGDEVGGDLVVGEAGGEAGAQCLGVQDGVRFGDRVSDEGGAAREVGAQDDDGAGDARLGEEGRLALPGFDAVAAQLDLVVGAAEEVQGPVRPDAHQVAGAVQPLPRPPVGIGDEACRGAGGAAVVAAGEPGSADVQLAGDSGQGRAQGGVEYPEGHSVERPSDGQRSFAGRPGVEGVGGGERGGLGGSVAVDDAESRCGGVCGGHGPGGHDVAAGPHLAEGGERLGGVLGKEGEQSGGEPGAVRSPGPGLPAGLPAGLLAGQQGAPAGRVQRRVGGEE
ncbi:hypothetical protein SPW_5237 [Streptomyces sp. W007]|nr:hypothetical protein SPW_5237 [Streptomyces sp. W007]